MRADSLIEREKFRVAAGLFKVLGNPRRIMILAHLQKKPLKGNDIARLLRMDFQEIAYDLSLLNCSHAIARDTPNRHPIYSITDHGRALLTCFDTLAELPLPVETVSSPTHPDPS
jgi:DNA-binding HxlR family transcriptional regulator